MYPKVASHHQLQQPPTYLANSPMVPMDKFPVVSQMAKVQMVVRAADEAI